MPKFIKFYDDALDPSVCAEIIERFDHDPASDLGKVSGNEGAELDLSGKQTTELVLPEDSWGDVIGVLQSSLSQFLGRYQADVKFLAGSDHKDLHAEPLRIKKYDVGGQFHWHIDKALQDSHRVDGRQVVFADLEQEQRQSTECGEPDHIHDEGARRAKLFREVRSQRCTIH